MRKFLPLLIFGILGIFIFIKLLPFFANFFPTATRIVFHPGITLKEVNNKTNVLLLGIGGGSHDGPNLTDTMILASIDWKKNVVTLIPVPRDLWAPDINNPVKKINEAYVEGGLPEAENIVEKVTGQKIQYGIRLDFQGFIDAIDKIGGVDVTVVRTLDDYNYPISGKEEDTCQHTPEELTAFNASASLSAAPELDTFSFFSCRFMHLHFDPGLQHMDGQTALEFARSRHGVGIEGSDFARSARQQLIIEAVRSKIISSAFLNPGKLLGLYNIMKSSVDMDISQGELGIFMDRLIALRNAKIKTGVIDYGDYATGRQGLLINAPIIPEFFNLDVLIPRIGNGNFTEIQQYVNCEITKGSCTVSALSPTPTP